MDITQDIGYGAAILDSKAEFTYSDDPRKNIIITTKIDNIENDFERRGNYNYTFDVGLVHRITGVDMRVSIVK